MKIKVVALVLAIALTAAVGGAVVANELIGFTDKGNPDIEISFWGDSIAEAFLGASPIGERDGFGYYGLVGRNNGFTYHNRSVSGHKTYQMYDYISANEDNARMNTEVLKSSDIICVSILGNDLLQNNMSKMIYDYLNGDTALLDSSVAIAKADFKKVFDYIKEVNPTATVIVQTVYNPLYEGSPIIAKDYMDLITAQGFEPEVIRSTATKMLDALNGIIYDYLEENPMAYFILDVFAEFNRIFVEDQHRGIELFYNDGVHPSNEGHAVISGLYQQLLDKLGYTNPEGALKNYKNHRAEQIKRLFADSVDVKAITKQIKSAATYDDVTNLYFRATEGKTAVLNEYATKKNKTVAFEEERTYNVTSNVSVLGLPIGMFLNLEESYIEFRTDGTMTLKIMLPNGIGSLLGAVDTSSVDVNSIIDMYAVELMPGFTLKDVKGSLGLLTANTGVEIVGLDYEHEGVKALVESLQNEGKLPAVLSLPDGLGLQYEGRYTVREVTNPTTGKTYTAVHMGAPYENGDGFIIMTIDQTEDGQEKIFFSIDFLQTYVEAVRD
ncbi:MAG: SGNH/GDSL hydrolase family protein [Clostridia bacterium]|nr:SGNH/GDSL hydrolase family protein [Clostridia bacterium]